MQAYIKCARDRPVQRRYSMMQLKRADYNGNYKGFNLKEGYWYGVNTETNQPIATSGWESNGCVSIYTLEEGKWEMSWYNIEETDFVLENIPTINTEGKMSFVDWLEEEQGISWNEFDEYPEQIAREIEESYGYYLYDGLPQFVQTEV